MQFVNIQYNISFIIFFKCGLIFFFSSFCLLISYINNLEIGCLVSKYLELKKNLTEFVSYLTNLIPDGKWIFQTFEICFMAPGEIYVGVWTMFAIEKCGFYNSWLYYPINIK